MQCIPQSDIEFPAYLQTQHSSSLFLSSVVAISEVRLKQLKETLHRLKGLCPQLICRCPQLTCNTLLGKVPPHPLKLPLLAQASQPRGPIPARWSLSWTQMTLCNSGAGWRKSPIPRIMINSAYHFTIRSLEVKASLCPRTLLSVCVRFQNEFQNLCVGYKDPYVYQSLFNVMSCVVMLVCFSVSMLSIQFLYLFNFGYV